MTDQEKMMELLKFMADKAAQDEINQLENAALIHQRMINAYMKAGFTRKEAIYVTTELIRSGIGSSNK